MTKVFSKSLKNYVAAVTLLWAMATAAWAAYTFLVPHPSTFAPEIGVKATFLAFLVLGSVPYFFLAFVFGVAAFMGTSSSESDA